MKKSVLAALAAASLVAFAGSAQAQYARSDWHGGGYGRSGYVVGGAVRPGDYDRGFGDDRGRYWNRRMGCWSPRLFGPCFVAALVGATVADAFAPPPPPPPSTNVNITIQAAPAAPASQSSATRWYHWTSAQERGSNTPLCEYEMKGANPGDAPASYSNIDEEQCQYLASH